MIATKDNSGPAQVSGSPFVHPLKLINAQQFAALGGNHVVFVRPISGSELGTLIPEASQMPEDATFHLVMAANGVPMMVSDSIEALNEWIGENEVEVAERH